MIAPGLLVGIFANDKVLKDTASWALRIYLATGFMMGIQLACQQTFVAIGQAKISLFLAAAEKNHFTHSAHLYSAEFLCR